MNRHNSEMEKDREDVVHWDRACFKKICRTDVDSPSTEAKILAKYQGGLFPGTNRKCLTLKNAVLQNSAKNLILNAQNIIKIQVIFVSLI